MPPEPEIIYEDENFAAINKPAGLIVHGTIRKEEHTLVEWLKRKIPEVAKVGDDPALRPGLVHRLDKETSGVMVVAKNQKYFEYLKSLFQKHLIKKIYLALVFGRLKSKSGRIEKPIGIRNGTLKRSVASSKMLKEAVTDYRLKRVFDVGSGKPSSKARLVARSATKRESAVESLLLGKGPQFFSLVEVEPKTGRTHQIRVHLASIGHPIVGDKLYGPRRQPEWVTRIMLHALSIEFPLGEGLASPKSRKRDEGGHLFRAEAEPPADYQKTIDFLVSQAEITYPQEDD